MAVAVTVTKRSVFGDQRIVIADLVFSSNYAAGGESLAASSFGLNNINAVIFDGAAVSTALTGATVVKYNYATSKVLHYETGAAGSVDLVEKGAEAYTTGSTVRCMVIGN